MHCTVCVFLLLWVPLVVGHLPHSLPWHVSCPIRCACQIKPWFSFDSLYHEAPTVDCNDLLLTKLPSPIPKTTHTLRLQSNLLSDLDTATLQKLPNLTDLDLSQNRFNASFPSLPVLQELFLSHNNLHTISPGAFAGLDNLLRLHINNNRLALRRVPGLKFLDLNKNRIKQIQSGDFRDMAHLKELGLNNMDDLVSIEKGALENLPELTKLEITNNPRLSYIHPHAFLKLTRLESLMLNSNSLSALHHNIMLSLPNLQEVSLHSNPLRCDCLFRWAAEESPHLSAEKEAEVSTLEMSASLHFRIPQNLVE
uniref:Leucine rich repeat neuronal 2 n=1 Tax=Neogobius melanostomus TaxID=47308 RepID=A0A8C6T0E9_9GOBI